MPNFTDADIEDARAELELVGYREAQNEALVELVAAHHYRVRRARELQAAAQTQASRAVKARADMSSLLEPSAVGLAHQALLSQIRRLRTINCPSMKRGCTLPELCEALEDELREVKKEAPGSLEQLRETYDLLGIVLHMVMEQEGSVLTGLAYLEAKLRSRLDYMENTGCTWAEAKEALA